MKEAEPQRKISLESSDSLRIFGVGRMKPAAAISELVRLRVPLGEAQEIAASLPEGFPWVFNQETHQPVATVLLHSLKQFRRPRKGGGSNRSMLSALWRAYDLAAWCEHLDACAGQAGAGGFSKPTQWDVNKFSSNESRRVSPRTGRRLSQATIQRRLAHILGFLKSADFRRIGDADIDPAYIPNDGIVSLGDIHPLRADEWRTLRRHLGPLPTERTDHAASSVWHLISYWALRTGARRMEIANLTVAQIRSFKRDEGSPDAAFSMVLNKTKGGGKRTIWVPSDLIQETQAYISGERKDAMALTGRNEHGMLFVYPRRTNGAAASPATGRPVRPDAISRHFKKAVTTADLRRRNVDPMVHTDTTGHTFHDLRHTYAVWTYVALVKLGVAYPWKRVQARLGHKLLETTERIYLRHIDDDEEQISDMLQRELRLLEDQGAPPPPIFPGK